MKVLLAIAGVVGGVLICAGVGVLVLRWLFDTDHNGREIDR